MDKEEQIIKRILDNANHKAEVMVFSAQQKADVQSLSVDGDSAQQHFRTVSEKKAVYKIRLEQALKVTKLNLRHETQKENLLLVDKAFEMAKKELMNLKDKDYKDLIKKLIQKHAENGDTVVVSKQDQTKLSAAFINSFKQKLTRKVGTHTDGGIILQNKKYDKVLTFDRLLAMLREQIEIDIARTLLEGEK